MSRLRLAFEFLYDCSVKADHPMCLNVVVLMHELDALGDLLHDLLLLLCIGT